MAPTEFKLSDIRGTDEEAAHVEWILAHLRTNFGVYDVVYDAVYDVIRV